MAQLLWCHRQINDRCNVAEEREMIATADLYDEHHASVRVCEVQFRSFGIRSSFFGACVTLKVFEDHAPVLEAVMAPGRERILVVDAGGSLRVGVMGDRVAAIAVDNGWIGAIIFGAVRDTIALGSLPFGVKALGATARRAWHKTRGLLDAPIEFGGVRFESNDWVYADEDAVLVSKTRLKVLFRPPRQIEQQ